jgi:hypothetical protein
MTLKQILIKFIAKLVPVNIVPICLPPSMNLKFDVIDFLESCSSC